MDARDSRSLTENLRSLIDIVTERSAELRRLRSGDMSAELSNFDPLNIDDQMARLAVETTEPNKIHDHAKIGKLTINAVYLSLRNAEIVDEKTGAVMCHRRSTIVDDKGQVWTTNSPVAARVTETLAGGLIGATRWEPPLPINAEFVPTGGGQGYLKLTINRGDLERVCSKFSATKGSAVIGGNSVSINGPAANHSANSGADVVGGRLGNPLEPGKNPG